LPRVDANVILRYLTDEPAEQAERVARLFDQVASGQVSLTLDDITVAEVVWTLSSFYKMPRKEIADAMLQLLSAGGIECRDGAVVQRALVFFEEKNVDYADALLCARMLAEGEPDVYSFDRHFDRIAGIRRLEPPI